MKKLSVGKIVIFIFILIAALICLFPIFIALINSFKTKQEMFSNIIALPSSLIIDNYSRGLAKMNYFKSFMNTVVVCTVGIVTTVFFSSMAAWSLCRTKTKLSVVIFSMFVFSMLIPFYAIMIPLYRVAIFFRLTNSLPGLGIIYLGLAVGMAVFMYHGFVKSIPYEVEESAYCDGCSPLKTFLFIVFPFLKPITTTISIMNILFMWNNFLLPMLILSDRKKYTLLLSTNMLFGQYSSDWPAILSVLLLSSLPVFVLYIIFQKNIIEGIADGAVKG